MQLPNRVAPLASRTSTTDGVDFVRCRTCGKHLRVISGRHLSKHGIEREAYMNEYRLSSDELIAKDFRRIQSSRGVISHTANANGLLL
jgi:ROS/MUCR transcriptional regulator protein